MLGSLVIFAGGVIDDLKELKAKAKLVIQLLSACIVYAFGIRLTFIGVVFHGTAGEVATFLLTVLWIVGMINAMNLIDGLDGLAAGIAAIASLCIAYAAYIHGHCWLLQVGHWASCRITLIRQNALWETADLSSWDSALPHMH